MAISIWGISDKTKFTKLYLDEFFKGSSLNSVDYELDFSLNKKKFKLSQGIFCTSLNDLIEKWNFQIPNYLKIDVDGAEDLVIKGASSLMSNKTLREIFIEIDNKNKKLKNTILRYGFEVVWEEQKQTNTDILFRRI